MTERIDKNNLMSESRMFRTVLPTPIRYKTDKFSGYITEMFGDGIAFVVVKDDGEEIYVDGNDNVKLR